MVTPTEALDATATEPPLASDRRGGAESRWSRDAQTAMARGYRATLRILLV
jgi:hypothetical protein